jgi:hypothetical protein
VTIPSPVPEPPELMESQGLFVVDIQAQAAAVRT